MIIRMTVNDNDFTHVVEGFAAVLYFQETYPRTNEYIRDLFDDMEKFRNMWCEVINGSGKLTGEQEMEFIDIIRRKYDLYIRRRFDGEGEDASHCDYLLRNINIKLQKSLTPRWENGEVVYVFPNAGGKYLTF